MDWRDWPYFAGDGAIQAADVYLWILGRVDDVINVAAHLGTQELESARSHGRSTSGSSRTCPRRGRARSYAASSRDLQLRWGDIMTLTNREVVETNPASRPDRKVERGELPRELSEQELQEIKALDTPTGCGRCDEPGQITRARAQTEDDACRARDAEGQGRPEPAELEG